MGLGYGTRDPGSGKNLSIPAGSQIQGLKRHRIPYLDPQHWMALTDISLSGDGKPGHNINIANGDFPKKSEDFNIIYAMKTLTCWLILKSTQLRTRKVVSFVKVSTGKYRIFEPFYYDSKVSTIYVPV